MGESILLGVILGAHAVRGQVCLRSFTENPLDIGGYGDLHDSDGRHYRLQSLRHRKSDVVVATVAGIGERQQAEALAGIELFVARSALGELSESDEFYHADLLDLAVRDEAGESLGKVVMVHNFGGGDLLEIMLHDGTSAMLAFTRAQVPQVVRGSHIVITAAALAAAKE